MGIARRARVGTAALCAATLAVAGLVLAATGPSASADTAPAAGTPATVSATALPTWQVDGVVYDQVIVGNTVYVTGSFTTARPPAGGSGTPQAARNIFAYDIRTGQPVPFNHDLSATGYGIAASPDGSRLYVVGDFTTVDGGNPRRHFASFNLADGSLNGLVADTDQQVRSVLEVGGRVYLGGDFHSVQDGVGHFLPRERLASLDVATRALTGWAPSADLIVWSLAAAGGHIYVGGSFTTLNGASASGMGSLNAADGSVQPWAANQTIRNGGEKSAITHLRTDGTRVYGSGFAFGTGNFEGTFAADPTTGSLDWVNDCHGDTYQVAPIGGVLYSVGHTHRCEPLGELPETPTRSFQFAMASKTSADGVNVGPEEYGWQFEGQPASRHLHWWPTFTIGTVTNQDQATWAVTGNADYVAIGGEFPTVNGVAQQGLTRFARPGVGADTQGPTAAPTVSVNSVSAGTARVVWPASFDPDNESLSYTVLRDGSPVATLNQASAPRRRPTMVFVDKGLGVGSSHSYQVRVTDAAGHAVLSNTATLGSVSGTTRTPYADAVIGDGAVDYWRLGQAPGPTYADTVGASNLTVTGGVTDTSGALTPSGDADPASTFGLGATAASGQVTNPSTFSVEAWIKTTTSAGGKVVGFGDSATGTSGNYDRHVYLDNAGHLIFGVAAPLPQTLSSADTYNDGQWHHVVGTLGRDGMDLYVDGNRVGTKPAVRTAAVYNGYWRVGGDTLAGWPDRPTSNSLAGDIDEVAVYPGPLSLGQVRTHYQASGRNVPPEARFTASPDGRTVAFDASGSTDADGSVASYAWDFGDGSFGSGVKPTHTYARSGTYPVRLTVTDNAGRTGRTTRSVVATNKVPVAAFSTAVSSRKVAFDGRASKDPDGSVASYAWDFGDGATGTGARPSHTYGKVGSFTARLTVTDSSGGTGTVTKRVTTTPDVVAYDNFSRRTSSGWGSAGKGGAWSIAGTKSKATVSSGTGRLKMSKRKSGPTAYLRSLRHRDNDVMVKLTLDKVPSGSAGVDMGVLARRANGADYHVRLRFLPRGVLKIGLVRTDTRGRERTIASERKVTSFKYAKNKPLMVRVQATGASPTLVRAKVWRYGNKQPSAWRISKRDSSKGLQTRGTVGLRAWATSSVRNTPIVAKFDGFRVVDIP